MLVPLATMCRIVSDRSQEQNKWIVDLCRSLCDLKPLYVFASFSAAHNIMLHHWKSEFLPMPRRLMTIAYLWSPIMSWPLRDQNMALDGWLVKNCPLDWTDLQFYTSSATLIICQGRQETSLSSSARCRLLRNGFLTNFCLALTMMFKWLLRIDVEFSRFSPPP